MLNWRKSAAVIIGMFWKGCRTRRYLLSFGSRQAVIRSSGGKSVMNCVSKCASVSSRKAKDWYLSNFLRVNTSVNSCRISSVTTILPQETAWSNARLFRLLPVRKALTKALTSKINSLVFYTEQLVQYFRGKAVGGSLPPANFQMFQKGFFFGFPDIIHNAGFQQFFNLGFTFRVVSAPGTGDTILNLQYDPIHIQNYKKSK